ncbi:response regulator [Hyalangium rubrum]|uniref:Response regulator n=1 Tax=Hyalangium rubrum TaxID=3103134 RepID=A0ABU5HHC4_9BACT|nr:response regulator [Hyalangium sp. s54d21]MDY7232866.1 response regulator [Hyalangium sp. s54d21]
MKVLLVEDDPSLREGMGEVIADFVDVRTVASVDAALAALREERFELVLADLRIGGAATGGKTILEAARRRLQPVAIVSAAAEEEIRKALHPFTADALLGKPFQLEEMTALVERFLALRKDADRLSKEQPPESAWTEAAPGVYLARQSSETWVRFQPGTQSAWPFPLEGTASLLLEGDLEVGGEPQTAPRYFFLSTGHPPTARSEKGCLVLSLPLRG